MKIIRTNLVWCFVTTLLLSQAVLAVASDTVCEDLHRLSCAPGTYDDGTGVGKSESVYNKERFEIIDKVSNLTREKFATALKNPRANHFRKIVLSATGLSLNPECDGADLKPSQDCLVLMAEGAANIAIKKMFASSPSSNTLTPSGRIEDQAFLVESDPFLKIENEIFLSAKKEMGLDELEKKIRTKIFPQIRDLLIQQIEASVQNPKLRKELTDKISAITFEGSICGAGDSKIKNIAGLLNANAFQHPVGNRFQYCAGHSFLNSSEFRIARTLAHELSHAIDPCGITRGPQDYTFKYKDNLTRAQAQEQFPFPGILQCLRGKDSVNAKFVRQVRTQVAMPVGTNIGNGLGGAVYKNGGAYGPLSNDDPDLDTDMIEIPNETFQLFCKGDQITEAFSDWMAAEITPKYISKNFPNLSTQQYRFGYSNVWRGQCNDSDMQSGAGIGQSHPVTERRNNYILLMQPQIRSQMGCPPTVVARKYCALKHEADSPSLQKVEIKRSARQRSTP